MERTRRPRQHEHDIKVRGRRPPKPAPQHRVQVLDNPRQQQYFETECGQIVVEEQGAFHEKVGQEMEEVAGQKNLAQAAEFLPRGCVQVVTVAQAPQEVEHQEAGVYYDA